MVNKVGVIYYRIKLNDIDNKYSYSNTISARQSNLSNETVTIYPSPFTTQINIDYVALQATDINIELTDAAGRLIVQKMVSLEEGSNTIHLDQLNALSTGSYYIKLKDINSGELFIRKLVK